MDSRSSSAPARPTSGRNRNAPSLASKYRRVFILDSRSWFAACRDRYDRRVDLVLTYDFGLKRDITALGGAAFYVDHLVDRDVMQENNYLVYEFFRSWHRDAKGADLFTYKNVPFGFSFRLEYWNDYLFYVRAQLCLERVRALSCEEMYVGTALGLVESILGEMGVPFVPVKSDQAAQAPSYYFPIHRWMNANIRHLGLKSLLLKLFGSGLGTLLSVFDRVTGDVKRRPGIFVNDYYPTHEIINRLTAEGKLRVVGAAPSRARLWSRFIPQWGRTATFKPAAKRILEDFRAHRANRLVLTTGRDISEGAYAVIEERIASRVAESMHTLECVLRYLDRNRITLELLITNLGDATLVDCACRERGVSSYLIINGLLARPFVDDSKYATVINSYSSSIKQHYFRGMDNVVCLGDPRMDQYPPLGRERPFNPDAFTVTIGASGHNPTDLNSYVAVEFDFLHDVLEALSRLRKRGIKVRVVIKVRANGYRAQYEQFTAEYFPGLVDEILDVPPIRTVLEGTDFFISIYSQTLFEASCLGIACLYYRADDEINDPPFDGRSELVTVETVDDLVQALADFRRGASQFDAFLDRSVMERYIGPLDGKNVERNLAFIYDLVAREEMHRAS